MDIKQGGSFYHFYDGLWYDPAATRTHNLPHERQTRKPLSHPDGVRIQCVHVPVSFDQANSFDMAVTVVERPINFHGTFYPISWCWICLQDRRDFRAKSIGHFQPIHKKFYYHSCHENHITQRLFDYFRMTRFPRLLKIYFRRGNVMIENLYKVWKSG